MTDTTYTVYRATNSMNGMAYVGIDSDWPSERMRHETAIGDTDPFHRALRKYGPPLFRWEALLLTTDAKAANTLAVDLFASTQAPNGYNGVAIALVPTKASILDGLNGTSGSDLEEMVSRITPENTHELVFDEPVKKKGAITEEGRRKISEAVSRPVTVEGVKYRSIKEAAEKLGLPRHQLKMVLKGKNSVAYYKNKNSEAGK